MTPGINIARKAGISHTIHEYSHEPGSASMSAPDEGGWGWRLSWRLATCNSSPPPGWPPCRPDQSCCAIAA